MAPLDRGGEPAQHDTWIPSRALVAPPAARLLYTARVRRIASAARAQTNRRFRVALALIAASAILPAVATSSPPRIVVRAPAELAPVAAEIERLAAASFDRSMRLVGLTDAGAPIVVVLAPEGSPAARSASPWISGWADGAAGVVVLLPSRVGRYPDQGLGALLRHEVTHVLVARAAGGEAVPRWFDEGLAMAAGRDWAIGDRARVTLAVMRDGTLPMARLERAFAGGESEMQAAYALAGDLVRELLARYGDEVAGRILAGVAGGASFRTAFLAATGVQPSEFELDYWSRRTLWDRWVPVISSSVLLWAGVALLAVAASRRKRARAAAIQERWEAEDAAVAEASDERESEGV